MRRAMRQQGGAQAMAEHKPGVGPGHDVSTVSNEVRAQAGTYLVWDVDLRYRGTHVPGWNGWPGARRLEGRAARGAGGREVRGRLGGADRAASTRWPLAPLLHRAGWLL